MAVCLYSTMDPVPGQSVKSVFFSVAPLSFPRLRIDRVGLLLLQKSTVTCDKEIDNAQTLGSSNFCHPIKPLFRINTGL